MAPPKSPLSLAEHRDPRWLWPTLAAVSVGVHLGLLLVLGLVRLEIQPVLSSGKPIPIRLVDEGSGSDPNLGVEPSAVDLPAPIQPEATTDPTQTEPNWEPAAEENAPITSEAQPPSDTAGPPANVPTQPESGDAIAPQTQDQNSSPEPVAPPTESGEPATAGPLPDGNGSGGGQLVPLKIQADPNGRDLPDVLPQFQYGESLLIQPYLAGCGGNIGSFSSLSAATVQMRLTVEADGRISQAAVVQSSGDPTADALAICLVQQGLHLTPATTEGVGRPTDAVLLEVRLQR
ncbi:MAG TPA: energy transducer TonB [Leptolyngbyaceae cyanobacterium]